LAGFNTFNTQRFVDNLLYYIVAHFVDHNIWRSTSVKCISISVTIVAL